MPWNVRFHAEFEAEFVAFEEEVQDELLATVNLLEKDGPMLGRPHADTLKGSKYSNMKELRFDVRGGVWRTAFAFDPDRRAIVLVAGNKSGINEDRFYKWLIGVADRRYSVHLEELKRWPRLKG